MKKRSVWGSPPLTRELRLLSAVFECAAGITPAYAGTTDPAMKKCPGYRDHPRLRGNYCLSSLAGVNIRGSPPLTRELLLLSCSHPSVDGITPAYAGTTAWERQPTLTGQDHPRLRGNYSTKPIGSSLRPGSPPLTRELPPVPGSGSGVGGITPAYAGTTILEYRIFG